MIRPKDFALDAFEAALAALCGAYVGAGLDREAVRDALERRLAAYGGPRQAPPLDLTRPATGRPAFVVLAGGDDA